MDDRTEATRPLGVRDVDLYGARLEAGAVVGDWLVEAHVEDGGFGAVYRATRFDGSQVAALKVLHPIVARSPHALARFRREVRLLRELHHPGIVDVIGAGTTSSGRPYLAMEWLGGGSLAAWLRQRGALPIEDACTVARQVCAALDHAHGRGVVHRDLTARNVMVVSPAPLCVKLVDFGIARLDEGAPADDLVTTAGLALGSPEAMAPEQLRGEPADARTDVYALGVLLFRLVAARPPFDTADPATLEECHLELEPPPLSSVVAAPPWLDAVVARCLAKAPAARFASARDVDAALQARLTAGRAS